MGQRQGGGCAHVASGTGWSLFVIFARYPVLLFHQWLEAGAIGGEGNAMLGFVVDFNLWMIRAHVAATAVFRHPRLGAAEVVPKVTSRARAFGTVRVQSAHARVRPGRRVQLAARQHLDFRTVALPAPADGGGRVVMHIALHHFRQHIVQAAQYFGGFGMVAGLEFFGFLFMATGTVLGGNNRGDEEAIMLKTVHIALVCLMAFVATHPLIGMAAEFPLIDNAASQCLVAIQTGLTLGAAVCIACGGVDSGRGCLVCGWFRTHWVCQTQ